MKIEPAAAAGWAAPLGDALSLGQLLDRVSLGLAAVNREGAVVAVNRTAAALLRESQDAILGAPLRQLFLPSEQEKVAALVARALSEERPPAQTFQRATATGFQWLEVTGAALPGPRQEQNALVLLDDVTESKRAERRLAAQYAVTRVLTEAETLAEAGPRLLEAVGETLGWEIGTLWRVDEQAKVLRPVAVWRAPSTPDMSAFEELTWNLTFARGAGLPGRVWQKGEPLWVKDVLDYPNFPRATEATKAGLRTGFAFAVKSRGRGLGVIDFFSRQAQAPDEDVLRMIAAVGSQIGQFIERKESEQAVRESEARKSAVLESALDGVVTIDEAGRIVDFNPAAEQKFGYVREDVVGQDVADVLIPPALREQHREGRERYIRTREARILGRRVETTARRADGSEFPVELSVTGTDLPSGLLFTAYIRDITRRRRNEEAQRFIAEASAALVSSLEYEETLSTVARLAVPALADWCIVDEIEDDGTIRRVARAAADPSKEEALRELQERYPPDWTSPQPAAQALRAGAPVVFTEITSETIARIARDATHAALLERLDPRSTLALPLKARGRTLGSITFSFSESGRRYGEFELALAEEVARRAAIAIDHARLYASERRARAEAEEAQERLNFLVTASAVLASSLDYRATLKNVAHLAVSRLADWCVVYLLDDDGRLERLETAHADPEKEAAVEELNARYPLDPSRSQPILDVLRTGQPRLLAEIPDALLASVAADEEHLRLLRELGLRSSVIVPLAHAGRTVGAIALVSAESGRRYDEEDLTLAEELARRAGVAVVQARLYEAERRARADAEAASTRLRDLQIVTEAALAHLTLDDLLDELLGRIRQILGVDTAAILLLEDGMLVTRAAKGLEPEGEQGLDLRVGEGFAGRVVAERGAVVLEDVGENDLVRPFLREQGVHSLLGVPLAVERRVIGVLHVGTRTRRAFTDDDARVLQLVADRVALAIENAALYRETEQRAHAARVLEHVADGVVLVDRDGAVRLWNPAAERITGLAAASVLGRPASEAISGWETVARLVPASPAEVGSARAETVPLEVDGREIWLSISGVGFEEGTVYAFRDLSEERALDELKTEFVATVSHELRTPLAAIYGAAMTLRRQDVALDPESRANLLSIISNESDRLARIVDDILWASRLDSGRIHLAIQSCDARQIATEVLQAANAHLRGGVSLQLVAPASLPDVAADPDKVRQVLVNLVENAVKYSPEGGVVEVRVEPVEGRIRFSVRDEGLGIPLHEQQRIFEKFYRLDPNLTRGVGGTGLGLYISRELVRRMHGRIWVSSKEGEGSTFFVELPVAGG